MCKKSEVLISNSNSKQKPKSLTLDSMGKPLVYAGIPALKDACLLLVILGLGLCFSGPSTWMAAGNGIPQRKLSMANSVCPLNFNVLRNLIVDSSQRLVFLDVPTECHYMFEAIRLVRSAYLQSTGYFFPTPNSSNICWDSYQNLVDEFIPGFNITSTCGFKTSLISGSCMNIQTRSQFENKVSKSKLQEIRHLCVRSLDNESACRSCRDSLSSSYASYFDVSQSGNESECTSYPFMYAGILNNRFGQDDIGTIKCLFSLDFTSTGTKKRKHKRVLSVILVGSGFGLLGTAVSFLLLWRRKQKLKKRNIDVAEVEAGSGLGMGIMSRDSNFFRFTFEEIKKATKNFSRDNIIGKGGYGNVYKGISEDGSEVAIKRLKNCSAAGDANFAHEVEVIASVRHVNLVALRGYCTATVPMGGHQRIIVCDLVHNGSLYDHLFGSRVKKLSWPTRQKIAIGMARGLAYLHYGAQPAIIHRDVTASNILLDETFEPKLADFGLAKFTPEGCTHLSTRVAGTLGYVAPEYALYGKLSERTDVYGFGVVLLELLSGKKAVISIDGQDTLLLTDWAWSVVREGRLFDVIDESMPELGPPEVMEKYVLVALLSSHPILYARPTMDQIVKILESDFPVPSVQEHPFSLLAEMSGNEHLVGFCGLNIDSGPADQKSFLSRIDQPSILNHGEI